MSNLAPTPNGIARFIPGFALFKGVSSALERLGIELWLARANQPLRDLLQATSLTKRPGKENIYPSVRNAVMAYRQRFGTT